MRPLALLILCTGLLNAQTTVVFRQGQNGYNGVSDTML